MTREIGDILIQEVLDHKDYEVERKIRLIEKIEKLVMASMQIAANIASLQADKQEKIAEATEMIQNGSTVREVAEATGISYRQAAKISKDIHTEENMQKYNVPKEVAEAVTEVQEAAKQEHEELQVIRPTRDTKPTTQVITTDNDNDNTSDNNSDNNTDNGDDNEVTEEEFHKRLAEERNKWEQERQQQQQQVVVMNNDEYERASAYKRLEGLAGLKKLATKHAIDTYFEHKEKFRQLYGNEPGMKFAYTLEDYLDRVREEPK